MRKLVYLFAFVAPTFAFAVGSGSPAPPKPTATTQECANGQIWDEDSKACVAPKESSLNDDARYSAAREFAYAGQYEDALGALEAMSEGQSDRVLTYLGFVHRKMGDTHRGMAFYAAAIDKNPDNLLARSYRGQALVLDGNFRAARAELSEIRARGGRGSWPETALRLALDGGVSPSY